MAELAANDRQAAMAAVAHALSEEHGAGVEMALAPAALDAGDLKDIFCKNWGTVKTVLQFLSGFLPALVRPIVAIVIKAGDALHGAICK